MRKKQSTIDKAWIRRQIRLAIRWDKVNDSMPCFYSTDNYKQAKQLKYGKKGFHDKYYYTKSTRAIEEIAEKIYNKISKNKPTIDITIKGDDFPN